MTLFYVCGLLLLLVGGCDLALKYARMSGNTQDWLRAVLTWACEMLTLCTKVAFAVWVALQVMTLYNWPAQPSRTRMISNAIGVFHVKQQEFYASTNGERLPQPRLPHAGT